LQTGLLTSIVDQDVNAIRESFEDLIVHCLNAADLGKITLAKHHFASKLPAAHDATG
jgi:hypothetical protein